MHGIVKWFDPRKGFGFIITDDGRDVFVHQSAIQMEGFRKLVMNGEVTFDLTVGNDGREVAVNVVPQAAAQE